MAGRRRSFPPRRMGPDLLRLLDGPIVSRRRSRPPAPPRGMGPNHPRAAGGSLQRVSRAAAMHQRSAGRKRPWGRNAPRSDQAGRVLERRGVSPDEGLRARWWQWPRHPTFRAMARVAEEPADERDTKRGGPAATRRRRDRRRLPTNIRQGPARDHGHKRSSRARAWAFGSGPRPAPTLLPQGARPPGQPDPGRPRGPGGVRL